MIVVMVVTEVTVLTIETVMTLVAVVTVMKKKKNIKTCYDEEDNCHKKCKLFCSEKYLGWRKNLDLKMCVKNLY